jgi:hypothetical protein
MGLSIKNASTVNKVRRLAKLTQKGLTEVVDDAVSRELHRLQPTEGRRPVDTMSTLRRIQKDYAAGRLAATGTADEIVGYNDRGHLD